MIRLIITDDNTIVRNALAKLLGREEGLVIVAQASNGEEALKLLKSGTVADILLADLNMPGIDGLDLTSEINRNHPDIKVVILTMHYKEHFVAQAIKVGAAAYVLKHAEPNDLIETIRRVAVGKRLFPQF